MTFLILKRSMMLGAFSAAFAFAMASVPAASIVFDPVVDTVSVGAPVALDVKMDFTDDPTLGGGFDVFFDPIILNFDSWVSAGLGDPGFAREPDVSAGELNGIAFGDFNGLMGPALVGTLNFTALSPGDALLTLAVNDFPAGPFVSATTFVEQTVEFGSATVTVVPEPAVGWLFGSGLMTMVWGARRPRKRAFVFPGQGLPE